MHLDLRRTTAIVTGSSGGIGTALVRALLEGGATVVGIDLVPPGAIAPQFFVQGDVRDPATMEHALAEVTTSEWSFVPCAAIGALGSDVPEDTLDVNFRAVVANTRTVIMVLQRPGAIIFIGSNAACRHAFANEWEITADLELQPFAGTTLRSGDEYGVSKWAVEMAARRLAHSLASRRIRVNCVVPGVTSTPLGRRMRRESPGRWRTLVSEIPFGRPVVAAEVAGTILFLMSPIAQMVTGSVICIDGGWRARTCITE